MQSYAVMKKSSMSSVRPICVNDCYLPIAEVYVAIISACRFNELCIRLHLRLYVYTVLLLVLSDGLLAVRYENYCS